jgi:hypothetical protein
MTAVDAVYGRILTRNSLRPCSRWHRNFYYLRGRVLELFEKGQLVDTVGNVHPGVL